MVFAIIEYDIDRFLKFGIVKSSSNNLDNSIKVWKAISDFLCLFCKNHISNTDRLAPKLPILFLSIGLDFAGVHDIAQVDYKTSSTYYSFLILLNYLFIGQVIILILSGCHTAEKYLIPKSLCIGVLNQLTRSEIKKKDQSLYISILQPTLTFPICDDEDQKVFYKPANQILLLRLLTKKEYCKELSLYVDETIKDNVDSRDSIIIQNPGGKVGDNLDSLADVKGKKFQERRDQIIQFRKHTQYLNFEAADYYCDLLKFHASCVEILALCCAGKNYGNAVKSAALLPFEVSLLISSSENIFIYVIFLLYSLSSPFLVIPKATCLFNLFGHLRCIYFMFSLQWILWYRQQRSMLSDLQILSIFQ